MAAPYVNNGLILNITETEITTSNVIINRSQQLNPTANVGTYEGYYAIANTPQALTLPAPVVYQFYIKNIDPTGNVTVSVTPQGGAAAVVCRLKPGDVSIPCWSISGDSTNGLVAVTLTPSALGTLVEFFLGA
jgi:hypothetical protein